MVVRGKARGTGCPGLRRTNVCGRNTSESQFSYLCIWRFQINRSTVTMSGGKSMIRRAVRALCIVLAAVAILLSGT
ncbi:MAG: hypothetical protein PUB91_05785, partial [Bacteroidales bacterium]|nr:hypothetical protein [Bacteroidales bacterium]